MDSLGEKEYLTQLIHVLSSNFFNFLMEMPKQKPIRI